MAWLLPSVLAALALARVAHARDNVAVVSIEPPSDLAGNHAGRFIRGWAMPASEVELPTFTPPADANGCAEYPEEAGWLGDFVAVVGPGNCSIAAKAAHAEQAGARGIVLAGAYRADAPEPDGPKPEGAERHGLFVVAVPGSVGEAMLAASGGGERMRVAFAVYHPLGLMDPSLALLAGLATFLVIAGAFFATADLRLGSPIAPRAEEVLELGRWFPIVWCFAGSAALVVLYFLMRYLIYVLMFSFCMGGVVQITELVHKSLRYCAPALQKKLCTLPLWGCIEVTHLIAFPCACSVVVCWLLLRNSSAGWLPQDIIGAACLCFIQRTMRLTSIKIAAALLTVMFFFDIFWVFLSPYFFEKSVMVVVATGGGTGESVPLLLRIPAIGDPLGRDRMLGFGDIALPGLLISFLRRHDMLSRRSLRAGYFAPAVAGYAVSLCGAFVALHVMKVGQPALLYLVPGTLGTTLLLACGRRELKALWQGRPCPCAEGADCRGPAACNYCPAGHKLAPAAAEAGRCDGCQKAVPAGEQVMDCRQCNWYLCATCRPVDGCLEGEAAAKDKSPADGCNDGTRNVDLEAEHAQEQEPDLEEGRSA